MGLTFYGANAYRPMQMQMPHADVWRYNDAFADAGDYN